MSLYAKYIAELKNDRILETAHGFATYRTIPEQNAVYIVDIFVERDFRRAGMTAQMADEIAKIAKKEGLTKMIDTITPSIKSSTASMKTLLAYGMTLQSSGVDFIIFEKPL